MSKIILFRTNERFKLLQYSPRKLYILSYNGVALKDQYEYKLRLFSMVNDEILYNFFLDALKLNLFASSQE